MKQLNLLIKRCEECPYYQYDPRVSGRLCYFRPDSPFALDRGGRLIDRRCELSDAPPHVSDDSPEMEPPNPVIFQQSALATLPEEWLQEMTPEEREQISALENERIERMLREEGFDPYDDEER